MDKPQFTKDISDLFDGACDTVFYSATQTFSPNQKTDFIEKLWTKVAELQPIDFSSPQAIAAMMNVQRRYGSIQDQMVEFPTQFALEVEKAKQKGKKS